MCKRTFIILLGLILFTVACKEKTPFGWEKIERRDFIFYSPKNWIDTAIVAKTIDTLETRAEVGFSFTAEKINERLPKADDDGVVLPLPDKKSDGISLIVYEQPRYNMADCQKRYDSCYVDKTATAYSDVIFKELDASVFNARHAYQVNFRPLMKIYHAVYHVFILGDEKDVWISVYCLSEKGMGTADSIIQTIRIK